jgi:CRISPR-associated protein Csy2
MKNILLIPKIKIQNANALSSPYTIGFPAMTAWLGATHALERKLKNTDFAEVQFKSMSVICHNIDLQTYRGDGDFVHSIIGTGNPLDKTGKRPSFIEEARCHLTVSLIIECGEVDSIDDDDEFTELIDSFMLRMKLASGDCLSFTATELIEVDDEKSQKKLLRRLMPGYCLIERRDLMIKAMDKGQDAIDSLLDYLKVTHHCETDNNEKVEWKSSRIEKGWIVPIATGFHGISELGKASNQRDSETDHRFAESIVTLGEFIMPYRINNFDNMLWHYHTDLENNLYICQQNKPIEMQF